MTWTPNGATCRVKFNSQPAEVLCEALNAESQRIIQNWMTIGAQVTIERWGYQTALIINRCPTGEKYEKERRGDGTIVWGLNRYTMLDIEQELWCCNPTLDTNLIPSTQVPRWKWVSKADYEQYKGLSQLVIYLFDTKGGAHARPWWKHTKQVKLFSGVCPIEPYELPKSVAFCGECKCWGHCTNMCRERSACCDKCSDNHITDMHEFNCVFCEAKCLSQGGLGVSIVCPTEHAFCSNCGEQGHSAKSGTCWFQKKHLNLKWHQSLENQGKFDVRSMYKFFQSVRAKARQAFKSAEDATLEAAADAMVNAACGPNASSKQTYVAPGSIRFTTYKSPLANVAGPSGSRYQGLDIKDGKIPD